MVPGKIIFWLTGLLYVNKDDRISFISIVVWKAMDNYCDNLIVSSFSIVLKSLHFNSISDFVHKKVRCLLRQ